MRAALADAGLPPAAVDAVEAHGTGTTLGDPIEAQAIQDAYGHDRPRPLWLGSLKSNIGHTQAAAGVGGVIKMVMAMRNERLPRTLHAENPTPHVDWTAADVALLREAVAWRRHDEPRRCAVSSFGISGTNAHIVLEEPPEAEPVAEAAGPDRRTVVWPLSARTPKALRGQAERLHRRLAEPGLEPADVARTLVLGRGHLDHRAVVVGADAETLAAGVARLAAGAGGPQIVRGAPDPAAARPLAMVFTGQGSQRPGMGAALYREFPAFARAFDEVCEQLDGQLDAPLRDVLFAADDPRIHHTEYAQPGIFAVEVALFRLLGRFGVTPGLVAGHSIGELTAAHVAGIWSLADAATVVAARGRLMQRLRSDGAMIAIEASEAEILPTIEGRGDEVAIAAINGPTAVVLSGDGAAVEEIAERWRSRGRRTRRLRVSHAFHSPHMDLILGDFRSVAKALDYRRPVIPIVAEGVTGPVPEADLRAPDHWVAHVRETVRFAAITDRLRERGAGTVLEVGPDAILTPLMARSATAGSPEAVPTLRADQPEPAALLTALARLHARGRTVDWSPVVDPAGARADLPTYAFQRRTYWLEPHPSMVERRPVAEVPAEPETPDRERLAAAPAGDRPALVRGLVRELAAEVMGVDAPSQVPVDVPIMELGLTSLMAVDLRNRLAAATGLELPAALLYDHPTFEAVIAHVSGRMGSEEKA
jgi:acyl transferase domain-containing protein